MWPFGTFNRYPYTDFHELNTDFLIQKIGQIDGNLQQSEEAKDAAVSAAESAEESKTAAQTAETGAVNAKNQTQQLYDDIGGTVAPQVTDWLKDNVNPVGSAVIVDNSLTISGAAADAKVTGDSIRAVSGDSYNKVYFTNTEARAIGNASATFPDQSTIHLNGDNTEGGTLSVAFNGVSRATSDYCLTAGKYLLKADQTGTGAVRYYYKNEEDNSNTRIYPGQSFTVTTQAIFYLQVRAINYSNFTVKIWLVDPADYKYPYTPGNKTAQDNVSRALSEAAFDRRNEDVQYMTRKYPYVLRDYLDKRTVTTIPAGYNLERIQRINPKVYTTNYYPEGLASDGFRFIWFTCITDDNPRVTQLYKYDTWTNEIIGHKSELSIGHANSIAYVPSTNRLYITGLDFYVYEFDADTLDLLNTLFSVQIYSGTPGYISFCAYDTSTDRILYWYHTNAEGTGNLRKAVFCNNDNTVDEVIDIDLADDSLPSGLAVDHNYIYAGSGDSKILVFNKSTGAKRATRRAEISTYSNYAESEDFDFIGKDLYRIYKEVVGEKIYTSITKLIPYNS